MSDAKEDAPAEDTTVYKFSCTCGDCKWDVTGNPLFAFACWCTLCRRAHGSTHITAMCYPDAKVKFTSGADNHAFWKAGESTFQRHWCKTCGAKIMGTNPPYGMTVMYPAHLLGDDGELATSIPDAMKPQWHQNYASRQSAHDDYKHLDVFKDMPPRFGGPDEKMSL